MENSVEREAEDKVGSRRDRQGKQSTWSNFFKNRLTVWSCNGFSRVIGGSFGQLSLFFAPSPPPFSTSIFKEDPKIANWLIMTPGSYQDPATLRVRHTLYFFLCPLPFAGLLTPTDQSPLFPVRSPWSEVKGLSAKKIRHWWWRRFNESPLLTSCAYVILLRKLLKISAL